MMEYMTEELMVKCRILSKLNFEVLEEEEELQITKVLNFLNDNELDEHMVTISVGFRASFSLKNVPNKMLQWDGRPSSAEEIRKSRAEADRMDHYRVLLPSGQFIDTQIKTEGLFTQDGRSVYAMQPKDIELNNMDPFYRIVPNRRNANLRLILF